MHDVVAWPGTPLDLSTGRRVFVRHAPPAHDALEPAVAVHGLAGSSTNWTTLMGVLRDDVDQRAIDLPGFGEAPPATPHSLPAYVADVVAYLETFGRPVHLLGNSMGGLISVLVAASRPDLVATLSLVAPAMPVYRLPAAGWATGALALPWLGERMLARSGGTMDEQQSARLAAVLYGDPAALDPREVAFALEQRTRWMATGHADAVLLGALRSIVAHFAPPMRRSVWGAASRLLCPTLVMLGDRDALIGAAAATRWRRTLPNARLVRLHESGHVAMMEHPDRVGEIVRTFLRDAGASVRPTGGRPADIRPQNGTTSPRSGPSGRE